MSLSRVGAACADPNGDIRTNTRIGPGADLTAPTGHAAGGRGVGFV